MSRKSQVQEIIDAYIHRNGNQEITGNILNRVLVAMLDAGVIDIIQDGAILPKDEDGNVVIPDFSMDGAVRYDIEQTLTEIEKELARRNIGAVDANFVGREVQDVYSALAGMITSEKNRAIGVENGLRSDLTAEIQRASTEELRIAGLVGALYTNAQIDAFLAPKMERVELAMIASETPLKITYKGQTTALTFEQIKTLVQNTAKFVTLCVDDAYLLIPSLDYYDDAVQFVGTNILTGQAEAVRVMINSSNVVSCYAIELEDSGHKVSSMENILPYDQYIKYPNVKAVIDYVAAHGGGLTPEQEQKLNESINQAKAEQVAHEAIDGELTKYGSISTAIKNHHDSTKQNKPIITHIDSRSASLIASANNKFFCDELEALTLTFPSNANNGDEFSVMFKSGATPTTLTFDGEWEGESFVPQPNTIVEVNAVYYSTESAWVVYTTDGKASIGIPDAPSDDKQYARKNGEWAEVEGGGATPNGYTLIKSITTEEETIRLHIDLDNPINGEFAIEYYAKANAASVNPVIALQFNNMGNNGNIFIGNAINIAKLVLFDKINGTFFPCQVFKGNNANYPAYFILENAWSWYNTGFSFVQNPVEQITSLDIVAINNAAFGVDSEFKIYAKL